MRWRHKANRRQPMLATGPEAVTEVPTSRPTTPEGRPMTDFEWLLREASPELRHRLGRWAVFACSCKPDTCHQGIKPTKCPSGQDAATLARIVDTWKTNGIAALEDMFETGLDPSWQPGVVG